MEPKIMKHKPLCFVSENVEDRLDSEYYNPKYTKFYKVLESSKYQIKNLGDKEVSSVTDGEHGNPEYVDSGVPYLRAINITSDGIDLENNIKFISDGHNETLKNSELKANDVLLTIKGTVGKVALFSGTIGKCNISRDIAKISVKKSINPKYVLFYLESFLGQTQMRRYTTGFVQDGLYLKNVKQLKIILPPRKKTQDAIVDEVEKYRTIAKENIQKYEKNLDEVNNILLTNLMIEIRERRIRSFITKAEPLDDRLDNLFCSPSYNQLLERLRGSEKKGHCKLVKGNELDLPNVLIKNEDFEKMKTNEFKYVDLGNTEKKFGKIVGFEEDVLLALPTRARQIMHENDVLIPRPIGSTDGIVIVPKEFDGHLCSTGFILVRPTNYNKAVLLWIIFKSEVLQKQFFYLQSGSLQPELTSKNFKNNVLVPIPKDEIVEGIVKAAKKRIKEAEKCMEKFTQNMEKSERVFSDTLLS